MVGPLTLGHDGEDAAVALHASEREWVEHAIGSGPPIPIVYVAFGTLVRLEAWQVRNCCVSGMSTCCKADQLYNAFMNQTDFRVVWTLRSTAASLNCMLSACVS